MAGRYMYSQTGINSNGQQPAPPPPPLGYQGGAPQAFSYGYSYGYKYPLATQSIRLAPGQAPTQAFTTNPPDTQKSPPDELIVTQDQTSADQKANSFFCDACDLALDSQQAFKSHRRCHVKCSDCSFEAAPKIVKAHYQGSHGIFSGSGFKIVTVAVPGCRVQRFRICVGNRPEDIERWISDRKKRFPRQRSENNQVQKDAEEKVDTIEKGTSGITSLLAAYGSSGSESDDDDTLEKKAEIPVEISGLPQKDEEIINTDIATNNTPPAVKRDKQGTRPCRYFFRNGTCFNGDSCRFSHDVPAQRAVAMDPDARKRKRGGHTTSDTLLRKLLAADVERESVLTMKLLEFIVDKSFFKDPSG